MTGFPREVRSTYRTQAEVAAERFAESPVGRMIAEIERYATDRKSELLAGAETPALASLMVEKFGYGLMIRDTNPPIWRRIRIEGSASLRRVHYTLQAAFGWTDSHPARVRDRRQNLCNVRPR